MNLRSTFARHVLLALGAVGVVATGCLSEEEAMMEMDEAAQAATATRIEAESQSWSTSSGDGFDASSSSIRLKANASGDYFRFSKSVAAGEYRVVVRYSQRNIYGNYQLHLNGASVGDLDGYSSSTSDSWRTVTLGTRSLSGNVEFKLVSTGRSSGATDYDLKVDYIELVPTGSGSSTSSTTSSSSSGGGGSGGSGGSGGGGGSGGSGGSTTTGSGGVVDSTIVVRSGQVYDGGGRRFIAGRSLGDGSQSESQKPVFKLENGAVLRNVVLGAPAADGIHTYGNVTLENIVWEDIGEDALTIKESGTVVLNGGSAVNGEDKVFQINAASTFRVSNFRASNAGKFIRQNGGTTFRVDVIIDGCDISHMDEAIFRTDSSTSTVRMTNTRYSDIGDALFIGLSSSRITTSNNTEY
ncbi:pectate lyase [Sorangium sp. So ce131]